MIRSHDFCHFFTYGDEEYAFVWSSDHDEPYGKPTGRIYNPDSLKRVSASRVCEYIMRGTCLVESLYYQSLMSEGGMTLKDAVLHILSRAQDGEYVGQNFDGKGLSVFSLCDIFKLSREDVSDIVNELQGERAVACISFAVMLFADFVKECKISEGKTGHKQYQYNDFVWECIACGYDRSYSDASDYDCVDDEWEYVLKDLY